MICNKKDVNSEDQSWYKQNNNNCVNQSNDNGNNLNINRNSVLKERNERDKLNLNSSNFHQSYNQKTKISYEIPPRSPLTLDDFTSLNLSSLEKHATADFPEKRISFGNQEKNKQHKKQRKEEEQGEESFKEMGNNIITVKEVNQNDKGKKLKTNRKRPKATVVNPMVGEKYDSQIEFKGSDNNNSRKNITPCYRNYDVINHKCLSKRRSLIETKTEIKSNFKLPQIKSKEKSRKLVRLKLLKEKGILPASEKYKTYLGNFGILFCTGKVYRNKDCIKSTLRLKRKYKNIDNNNKTVSSFFIMTKAPEAQIKKQIEKNFLIDSLTGTSPHSVTPCTKPDCCSSNCRICCSASLSVEHTFKVTVAGLVTDMEWSVLMSSQETQNQIISSGRWPPETMSTPSSSSCKPCQVRLDLAGNIFHLRLFR